MRRTNTAKWIEAQRRWRISVQKNGERKSFYSSTPGRNGQREANAKADAWLEDGVLSSSTRVDALLDEYLDRIKQTTGFANWRKEEGNVRLYIRPVIGRKKASELTNTDCQRVLDKAFRHKNKKGETVELSRKTLLTIRATLAGFVKMLRQRKIVILNSEDWTIPKGSRYKGKRILQPKDLVTLFSTSTTKYRGKIIEDPYIHAYRMEVITGLRPGELRGLRPQDDQGDRILVRRSINIHNIETLGKNENAVRSVPLSALAREELDEQLKDLPGDGTIFGITHANTYRQYWQRYCKENRISYVSPYELRHTFVSVVKNLPEGEVKSLVGHSRSMDTFGTYGHLLNGDDKQVAVRVNTVFLELLKNFTEKK